MRPCLSLISSTGLAIGVAPHVALEATRSTPCRFEASRKLGSLTTSSARRRQLPMLALASSYVAAQILYETRASATQASHQRESLSSSVFARERR